MTSSCSNTHKNSRGYRTTTSLSHLSATRKTFINRLIVYSRNRNQINKQTIYSQLVLSLAKKYSKHDLFIISYIIINILLNILSAFYIYIFIYLYNFNFFLESLNKSGITLFTVHIQLFQQNIQHILLRNKCLFLLEYYLLLFLFFLFFLFQLYLKVRPFLNY